ncbi:MAG: hypothetical protein KME15_16280 [Drouetiella hepatica Uher 2000/2452]|uniref:Uncharacterized protein n=1 Tax=Drouetiella hepatica Uher 2000/2452 TaxID=904376 RepID=A0A951UPX8_9CYAN|nr:hypothetical protein [Drouetiella hepatica Uher 2000/2452]
MQNSIFDLSQDEIEAFSEPIALKPLLSFKAIAHSDLNCWTTEAAKICSLKELQTLYRIIGIPRSGNLNKVLFRPVIGRIGGDALSAQTVRPKPRQGSHSPAGSVLGSSLQRRRAKDILQDCGYLCSIH